MSIAEKDWPERLRRARRKSFGSWNHWYGLYLRSSGWKRRRKAAIERAGGKCGLCGGTERLEAHHATYQRVGCEEPEDLRVLCKRCHRTHHEQSKMGVPIPMDAATRRIVREKAYAKLDAPPPKSVPGVVRRRTSEENLNAQDPVSARRGGIRFRLLSQPDGTGGPSPQDR